MVFMGQEHIPIQSLHFWNLQVFISKQPLMVNLVHMLKSIWKLALFTLLTNSSVSQPISAYSASNSAPVVGLSASAWLVKPSDQLLSHFHSLSHCHATYPADLGHIADSKISTHYSISNPHSLSAPSHAGPSCFPGAYIDDNRATKKARKS